MSRSTLLPRDHQDLPFRPVNTPRRLWLKAGLLGALVIPLASGAASALDPASGWPDGKTSSGWLQRHLELEHSAGSTVSVGPGSVAWARHLELEYAGRTPIGVGPGSVAWARHLELEYPV
jgi:hypothetical protein